MHTELIRLKALRYDAVVNMSDLDMTGQGYIVDARNKGVFKPNRHAQRQVATKLGIPFKYWEKMANDIPALLSLNFNSWVQKYYEEDQDKKVFIRCYRDEVGSRTGVLRAVLSNYYMPIDNLSLLAIALDAITKMKNEAGIDIRVGKCNLSETNFYVKFVSPTIRQEGINFLKNYRDPNNGEFGGLGRDNGIVSGFVISNSEVGVGSLNVSPMLTMKACLNNMIWRDENFSRRHIGSRMDVGVYEDDTKRSALQTIKLQIRDNIKKFLHPDFMGQQVKHIQDMAERKLINPLECARNMSAELGLNDEEIDSVLTNFMRQGTNESVFDVAQAITAFAHHQTPDKKIQLESDATGLMALVEKCDVARKN